MSKESTLTTKQAKAILVLLEAEAKIFQKQVNEKYQQSLHEGNP